MNKERIDKQFEFIREIDKEKFISRQTYLTDGVRKENDAEHAWHMAIMVLLLEEYSNEPIDKLKTISMLLIHDLVEIISGDTYAYDEEGKKDQRERELKAADCIFSILPEDQGKSMRALWDEFEEGETSEAKFAKALDRVQPMMLNAATNGKMWKEKEIKLSQVLGRNEKVAAGSGILWEYALKKFIKPGVENGNLKEDVEYTFNEKLIPTQNSKNS